MSRVSAVSLALVAIAAITAVTAASSLAAEPHLQMELVTVKGEQQPGTNDVFTVESSNVTCNNMTYSPVGEVTNGATDITLHPEYSSCTAFGFIGSNITTTGCNYTFMASGEEDAKNMFFSSGEIKVECESGKTININAGSSTCEVSIGSQTISTGVQFSNTTNTATSPGDFDVHTVKASVAVAKNKSNFGCPLNAGNGTGTYSGTTTMRCYVGNTQKECYIRD